MAELDVCRRHEQSQPQDTYLAPELLACGFKNVQQKGREDVVRLPECGGELDGASRTPCAARVVVADYILTNGIVPTVVMENSDNHSWEDGGHIDRDRIIFKGRQ